jgi:hypothetical protein
MLSLKLTLTVLLATFAASFVAATPAASRGGGARPHGGFQNAPSFQNAPTGANPTGGASSINNFSSYSNPGSTYPSAGFAIPASAGGGDARYACIIGIAGVANCTVTGTANASHHTPCACGHYYGFTR